MIDDARLAEVRLVALDVDGTIAGPDTLVPERTLRAMGAVDALGVPVIILTGRTRQNALDIGADAGLKSLAVACNGAMVFEPATDTDLVVRPMSSANVQAFRRMAVDLGLELTWWTTDTIYVDQRGLLFKYVSAVNQAEPIIADRDDIDHLTIVKMMACAPPERLDELTPEIFARVPEAARSDAEIVETVAPGSNKWDALSDVLAHYRIDPGDCLGVGDGGNDIPWLSRIGYPLAVANARAEVKSVTRGEIGSNVDEAVADLLEHLAEILTASKQQH